MELRERRERGRRQQARDMRRQPTAAEAVLWEQLRDRRLLGLKFRRQVPIDGYVADFCCRELRLILEADGAIHDGEAQSARDENRDIYLKTRGYTVLRFRNEDILLKGRHVLESIARMARHLRPDLVTAADPGSPSPGEGGLGGPGEGAGG